MTPHKHHDLIVAWAKGAQIQFRALSGEWFDVTSPDTFRCPLWEPHTEYRIKPEPIQDKEATYHVQWPSTQNRGPRWNQSALHNLKLTFDGETGELKKAEVNNEA